MIGLDYNLLTVSNTRMKTYGIDMGSLMNMVFHIEKLGLIIRILASS